MKTFIAYLIALLVSYFGHSITCDNWKYSKVGNNIIRTEYYDITKNDTTKIQSEIRKVGLFSFDSTFLLTTYNSKGNKLTQQIGNKKGANGEFISYYQNGKIKDKALFKNNKTNGKWITYNENGGIFHESWYINGLLDSVSILYYENGKIHAKTWYSKGKQTGRFEKWDTTGKILFDGFLNDSAKLREP